MCQHSDRPLRATRLPSRGLTLIELLIASAIMSLIIAATTALSFSFAQSWEYFQHYDNATQHARVALERIARMVSESTAAGDHPGVAVVSTTVGTQRLPDTLVVWRPIGPPANPTGPPLLGECLIYCPNPADPRQLVEISDSSLTIPISLATEITSGPYLAIVKAIKQSPTAKKTVLTDKLRLLMLPNGASSTLAGAVRFERALRPSEADWTSYEANATAWENLPWVQGIYSDQRGLRQSRVRIELQLTPDEQQPSVVFVHSGALLYDLTPLP